MKTILILIILLSTVDQSTAQDTFTLNDAIKAALEYNHNVQVSDIEQDKAENRVTKGYAGQLPSLSLNSDLNRAYTDIELIPGSFFENLINPGGEGGQSPAAIKYEGVSSTGFNAGLGTQFVIYDGMKGRLRYRMLETGSDLAGLQHRSEMESTVLDITREYVQAASLQNAISLKELSLTQSLDRYHMIETRREYGQASEQQLLQALSDLKSDSTEYSNLKLQFENTYRDLHTEIGWDRRDFMPLDKAARDPEMPHYEQMLNSLIENNTALKVRHRRIENSELNQKLTGANFMPTLTASAQYSYNYQHATDGQFETQEQLGVVGGLSLRIPIFTGGQTRTASQNAKATVKQERIRYEESEQFIRTRFENSWQQLLHLEDQLATERSNMAVYDRNYERAKDSFERGLITGVELRTAQLSLENARLRLSESEYQLILTRTTLQYLSGTLIQ